MTSEQVSLLEMETGAEIWKSALPNRSVYALYKSQEQNSLPSF